LNGTHHLLVYTDDVNIVSENINTITKNREALIQASREVGLKVNTERTKYMFVSPTNCRTKSEFTDFQ
jgi:hypothetical protein